jgi:hypothetical protein
MTCELCLKSDRPMTREHIFARWLIRQVHGGKLVPSSAPADATPQRIARLTADVCATCNAGWMSGLEVAFRRLLFKHQRVGPLQAPDRATLSRWFTKTAVLLARTHGRDLVPPAARPALVGGMPEGVEVFVARRRNPRQRVDFAVDMSGDHVRWVAVLVDDLIAHVARDGVLASRQGTRLWPLRTHTLRWDTLPVTRAPSAVPVERSAAR